MGFLMMGSFALGLGEALVAVTREFRNPPFELPFQEPGAYFAAGKPRSRDERVERHRVETQRLPEGVVPVC